MQQKNEDEHIVSITPIEITSHTPQDEDGSEYNTAGMSLLANDSALEAATATPASPDEDANTNLVPHDLEADAITRHDTAPTATFKQMVKKFACELYEIFSLSWPTVITNLCNSFMQMTDLSSVGHLNNATFMAAAGIGNSFYTMLLYTAFGLSTGLDTLTSQAVGAGNHELVVFILIRAFIIMT